jgi:hypothetical protein
LPEEPAGRGFVDREDNLVRIETSSVRQPHPAHAVFTKNKRVDACSEVDRLPRQTRHQLRRQTSHPARRKQRPASDKALQVVEKQARTWLQLRIKQHAANKNRSESHKKIFPESTAA